MMRRWLHRSHVGTLDTTGDLAKVRDIEVKRKLERPLTGASATTHQVLAAAAPLLACRDEDDTGRS